MEHDEQVQITGTMSDYLVEKLSSEEHGQEYATEYLKADFLTSVANALFTLRRQAGLTQAQVAELLHTKQSAIARLEADFDGAMSLRRFVDFSLACGYIPHHLTFAPIETARNITIAQPETSLTFENHLNWGNANFQLTLGSVGPASQATFSVSASATTLQGERPPLGIIEAQSKALPLNESVAA